MQLCFYDTTKEGAAWYQKVWNKVVDFYKNFLTKIGYNRVDLDGVDNMSDGQFGDFLANAMMSDIGWVRRSLTRRKGVRLPRRAILLLGCFKNSWGQAPRGLLKMSYFLKIS